MRYVTNQKGVALVTALLLTLVSLAMILAVIYFITQGATTSGLHKRYQTALEASHGGREILIKEIIPNTIDATPLSTFVSTLPEAYRNKISRIVTNECFRDKLRLPTAGWTTNCNADSISQDLKKSNGTNIADMKVTLSGVSPQPDFDVSLKVVDTTEGNTDLSGIRLKVDGCVGCPETSVSPQHLPYHYKLEVQGERQNSPEERANLTVLYVY